MKLQLDFRLVPIQAAVFAANFYIVKHFFVSPYLRLKSARLKKTEGLQVKTQAFEKESKALELEINKQIQEAVTEARKVRARHQGKAEKECEALLRDARELSESKVSEALLELEACYNAEKKKLSEHVSKLTPFVVSLLLGKKGENNLIKKSTK